MGKQTKFGCNVGAARWESWKLPEFKFVCGETEDNIIPLATRRG